MDRVEALSILEWLDEELQDRPPGVDPMRLRQIAALCARLRQAPGPPDAIAEQTAAVEAWARMLLSARDHWRYDRPGRPGYEEVRRRALAATRALRDLVQRGQATQEVVALPSVSS